MAKTIDPTPLGLFSFALTMFVLCCYISGSFGIKAADPLNAVVTLALFYGGGIQTFAGIWAFVAGNAFAGTAFTSYGAFWLSYGALFLPSFGITEAYANSHPDVLRHAQAVYLLAWTLFTCIMLVTSIRTTTALCSLFALLASTFVLLTTATFADSARVRRAGGFVGIVTAFAAWYNALAGFLLSLSHPIFTLPVGEYCHPDDVDGGVA